MSKVFKFEGRPVLKKLLFQQDEKTVDFVYQVYIDMVDQISRLEPGATRAGAVIKLTEKYRTEELPVHVSCVAGCNACCHWKVSVNPDEADLLMMLADKKKLEIDLIRLKIQKDFEEEDFWAADELVSRCVFLGEDQLCQVYEARPLSCRNHMVTSPAQNCSIPPSNTNKHNVVADLYPELIAAAYNEVVTEKGSMAEMILERLWKKKKLLN